MLLTTSTQESVLLKALLVDTATTTGVGAVRIEACKTTACLGEQCRLDTILAVVCQGRLSLMTHIALAARVTTATWLLRLHACGRRLLCPRDTLSLMLSVLVVALSRVTSSSVHVLMHGSCSRGRWSTNCGNIEVSFTATTCCGSFLVQLFIRLILGISTSRQACSTTILG